VLDLLPTIGVLVIERGIAIFLAGQQPLERRALIGVWDSALIR
jgi:hypothetical protein